MDGNRDIIEIPSMCSERYTRQRPVGYGEVSGNAQGTQRNRPGLPKRNVSPNTCAMGRWRLIPIMERLGQVFDGVRWANLDHDSVDLVRYVRNIVRVTAIRARLQLLCGKLVFVEVYVRF